MDEAGGCAPSVGTNKLKRGSESLSRVTEGNLGSVPLCGAVVGGAVVKARRACVCPSAGVLMISVEF